jgi:protein SCO1/2
MTRAVALLLSLFAITPALLSQDPPAGILTEIGVDQKLDAQLPLDAVFRDEEGRTVALKDYFNSKPVILSFVYFECPMLCTMTLNGLVHSLKPLSFQIGKEFEVVSISIDPAESPSLASRKKESYVKEYGRDGASAGWHFLTGDQESIRRITAAAGYRYKWDQHTRQWAHVSAIVIATPDGRVSQVLHGIEFSPRDVRLSLIKASEYKIGTIVDRALLYCYHYDPTTGRYGFVIMNSVRVAGFATICALAAFIVASVRRERRLLRTGK